MSVLDRFRHNRINKNTAFRITEQGREKLQSFDGRDLYMLLSALETGGSKNIDELAREANIPRGKVERLLPSLLRGGYVQNALTTGMREEL